MILLRRITLFLLLALTVYGCLAGKLFRQRVWYLSGQRRMFWVCVIYAVLCIGFWFWRRRWFAPALAVLMTVYTSLAVGLLAPLAVAYFLLACWLVGDIALGISIFATLAGLAMHFRIHYPIVYLAALAVPFFWWRKPRWHVPEWNYWSAAVAGFPVVLHWLLTLRPEVSADGLAMHLTIPMFIADQHWWTFDITRFIWAVSPMNGDWAFTIVYMLGGEAAAKLLNGALLLVIAAQLWEMTRSMLAVAMFASIPVVQLVTGSMFIENLLALLILGAIRALHRFHEEGNRRQLYLFAALWGAALATKFGALAYFLPALCFAIGALRKAERPWRAAAVAAAILLCFAAPPYVTAWRITGNPIFPYQNNVFQSAHFDTTEAFRDGRFALGTNWRTLYDATFHSRRYMEGLDGSFGFQHLLFLPLVLLTLRREVPYLVKISLVVAVAAFLLIFRQQSYLRYVYPAMALFSIAIAWAMNEARSLDGQLYRAWALAAVAVVFLNIRFLPAAGWYANDLYFNIPRGAGRQHRYVEETAPVRKLVYYLNAKGGDSPVCFLEGNQIAGLRRRAFTNSWHNWEFYTRLHGSTSPEQDYKLFREYGIQYFIAPTREAGLAASRPHMWAFLAEYTEREYMIGQYYVARWKPGK
ncbi:MAG TPA: glycosyltransferase family 39 protein [Bryobacteraceae bacterium]|nr:glycosyltransferase family 39 protein [Bryobacteraceae bacterium]